MTPVVHIAGPRGVGSSTVAFALYMLIVGDGHRSGYVDLSQLQFATPTPSPSAVQHNLAALWQGHLDAGATSVIATGRPEARLPGTTLVWVTAGYLRRLERLIMRRDGHGPPIPGDDLAGSSTHVIEALAATATPPPSGIDLEVDTNPLTAQETARWLHRQLPEL